MHLKKLILLLPILLLTVKAHALTIRLDPDAEDLYVTATVGSKIYNLNTKEASGDASSDTAPARVYVPIEKAGLSYPADADSNNNFFLLTVEDKVNYVFHMTDVNHVVNFPLNLITTSGDYYLYAAVKDPADDKYKVIKRYSQSPIRPLDSKFNMTFPISPYEICLQIESDCNALKNVGSSTTKSYLIYFFYKDTNQYTLGEEVVPGTSNKGIFFQANLSNKVDPTISINVTEVQKGDGRAIFSYEGSASIANPKNIRVINRTQEGTEDPSNREPSNAGVIGQILGKEYSFSQNGRLIISDLSNGEPYILSIVFVDMYNFSSMISPSFEVIPMAIQELLTENQCFLLTAGFGEEHYVITYFRHIRDSYLKKFALGNAFIKIYYTYGPKWAMDIYQNESLRSYVRGVAYMMYFIFNNFTLLIALMIFTASFFAKKYKMQKIKLAHK